jgi:hypothetical protein
VKPSTCDTNSACDSSGMCIAAPGACVRPTDCTGGKMCRVVTLCSGAVCTTCQSSAGTTNAFQPCTADGQCKSGLCDQYRKVCTTPCANAISGDADCVATHGPNVVCSDLSLNVTSGADGGTTTGLLGFCARGCGHDADCGTGQVCSAFYNDGMNRMDITCNPPQYPSAPKNYGQACTTASDCKNGACLSFGAGKYCSAHCVSSADCGGATPTCDVVSLVLPGGASQDVFMCQP